MFENTDKFLKTKVFRLSLKKALGVPAAVLLLFCGVAGAEVKVGTRRVALNLEVLDWTLPEPQDYRTYTDFVESPDCLTLEYNVPLKIFKSALQEEKKKQ